MISTPEKTSSPSKSDSQLQDRGSDRFLSRLKNPFSRFFEMFRPKNKTPIRGEEPVKVQDLQKSKQLIVPEIKPVISHPKAPKVSEDVKVKNRSDTPANENYIDRDDLLKKKVNQIPENQLYKRLMEQLESFERFAVDLDLSNPMIEKRVAQLMHIRQSLVSSGTANSELDRKSTL